MLRTSLVTYVWRKRGVGGCPFGQPDLPESLALSPMPDRRPLGES